MSAKSKFASQAVVDKKSISLVRKLEHNYTITGLWVSLMTVFIAFAIIYYSDPLKLFIPDFLIVFFIIFIFTKKNF